MRVRKPEIQGYLLTTASKSSSQKRTNLFIRSFEKACTKASLARGSSSAGTSCHQVASREAHLVETHPKGLIPQLEVVADAIASAVEQLDQVKEEVPLNALEDQQVESQAQSNWQAQSQGDRARP